MHRRYYQGQKLDIYYADDDTGRSRAAVGPQIQEDAKMAALLKRLADHGRLRNPDQMNAESFQGKPTKIFAVKAGQFRAYGFYCQVQGKKAFFISHFIIKKKQKLDKADYDRAMGKRQRWFN